MANCSLNTPIILLVFNRPDTTKKVFERIAQIKPRKLLVVADGPRRDQPGEAERCRSARAIVDHVDWDCQVLKNFAKTNMGCAARVSSGLDWAFGLVGEAIVLEDDCVPDPSFFHFCEDLLSKYRNDSRIMAIGGMNFQFGHKRTEYSYYFSRYNHCWGWASWRRAWRHYDFEMKLWPEVRDSGWLEDLLLDSTAVTYWTTIFQRVYAGHIDSWAYRWLFACWVQSGLAILPNVNLISNIGFGPEATHTKRVGILANLPSEPMEFPLHHPAYVIRDAQADDRTQRHYLHRGEKNRGLLNKALRYLSMRVNRLW